MSLSTSIYNISKNPITVSYLKRVDYKPETVSLEDVINIIRGNTLQEVVNSIRQTSNKEDRNELKVKNLPAFFPTLQLDTENRLTEKSTPTGIVQFDIDLDHNEGLEIDVVKKKVCEIPECIYAFMSPSGGFKFGVLTDFQKDESDTIEALNQRYRQAYQVCLEYVSNFLNVEYDEHMKTLKYSCFLSYDAEAYYNPSSAVLEINADCIYKPPEPLFLFENTSKTAEEVKKVLSYIPRHFNYEERLPVNFAVFNCIGEQGIGLLEQHWTTDSRDKLRKDLQQQFKSCGYGSFGYLVNIAKAHGYVVPTGRARKYLKPQSSDYKFEPLLSLTDGMDRLRSVVNGFFKKKQSIFLNISAGLGKTQVVLEILQSIPRDVRVLYLVKDHSLANEIIERFNQLPTQKKESFRETMTPDSSIVPIKGKDHRCEMPDEIKKEYKDAGVLIPVEQCNDCLYKSGCRYIDQFNELFSNIRLMTHNELTNHESAWFHGSDGSGPRKQKGPRIGKDGKLYKWRGWKPDLIIVDEDWFTKTDEVESLNTGYDSVRNILNNMINGDTLTEAIQKNKQEVLDDYSHMQRNKPKTPLFVNTKQYIKACKEQKGVKESAILSCMYEYVNSDDENFLHGLRLKDKKLRLSVINPIAKRYQSIPTLFLDATANSEVVKAILPDVEFHSIKVHRNANTNVYQLENFTITKKWLSEGKNRSILVSGLKRLVSKYKNVGLITYKTIPDFEQDFDTWLADQLGITLYGHFGALRGKNAFSDVDCLLVVGRHQIPSNELESLTCAIYGEVNNCDINYMDVPIRLANGKNMLVNSLVHMDSRVLAVNQHFSRSETIQAVERARLIRGEHKDVYVFTNESLGGDIEVSSFFRFEDYFIQTKYDGAIKKLIGIGFCQDKKRELSKLGLKESSIRKDRKGIESEFINAGIKKEVFTVKDTHRMKRDREYYVFNMNSLTSYLQSKELTLIPEAHG